MPLSLHPAVPSDIPHLTSVYLSSFAQDTISTNCFPRSASNTPSLASWWTSSNTDDQANQPAANYIKVVDDDGNDKGSAEKIVAYAKWNIPPTAPDGSLIGGGGGDDPDDMPTWPEGANVELCAKFFGTLARRRTEIMGQGAYCYLEIIATLPEYRGKGAAGKMLRCGIERADELGVSCYLEANPLGRPIYEKFGFRVVGEFTLEELGHVEYFMVRDVKAR